MLITEGPSVGRRGVRERVAWGVGRESDVRWGGILGVVGFGLWVVRSKMVGRMLGTRLLFGLCIWWNRGSEEVNRCSIEESSGN